MKHRSLSPSRSKTSGGLKQGGKFEFWRPIIGPQKLQRARSLHMGLVADLSAAIAECTGQALRLHLAEVELKEIVNFVEGLPGGSRILSLSWERLPCAGMLVLAPDLCHSIVAHSLNLPLAEAAERLITPIEESVLSNAGHAVARIHMAEYESAGLPGLRVGKWGGVQALGEFLPSLREIVVFQFRAEQQFGPPVMRMALDSEFLQRLIEDNDQEASFRGKKLTDSEISAVSIQAQISLHQFSIPVGDLIDFRPGSRIPLPDPDEAWLLGPSGERLLRLAVHIDHESNKARCTIKERLEEP